MAMIRFNKVRVLFLAIVAYMTGCTDFGWVSGNITVTQHDNATLPCFSTYSASPDWKMRRMGDEDYELIYSAWNLQKTFQGSGKYHVDTSSGFYNLSIASVTFDDAGEYQCKEGGGGLGHSFFLHVNDADECYRNIDGCSQYAECYNTYGSYSCKCLPGFDGNGFLCDDVNECYNVSTCDVNAHCNNTIGGFTCNCKHGYIELHPVGGCTDLTVIVASVGENVPLPCRSAEHAHIGWMFVAFSDSVSATYLYRSGKAFTNKISAESSNPYDGDYTIILLGVQFNESGFYVCFEKDGKTNKGYKLNITVPTEKESSSAISSSTVAGVVASVVLVSVVSVVVGVVCFSKLRQHISNEQTEPLLVQTAPPGTPALNDTDNCLQGLTLPGLYREIDFDYGLLDDLIRLGVIINPKKFEPYMDEGLNCNTDACVQLINDIINASTDQKELFLSALDETHQSHVTNYIRNNGIRPTGTADDWPLFKEFDVLDEQFFILSDLIDIKCGLLDKIISADILNVKQMAAVLASNISDRSKVKRLLQLMLRKSVAAYKKFIDCLVKTKQYRVVSLLDPSSAVTCPPLSEVHCSEVNANCDVLVELIDIRDSGLLRELESVDCLTDMQRKFIESAAYEPDCIRRLLNILRRGSQSDYDKFILCLGKTGQQHVVNVLRTDTAVSILTAHGTAVDKYQSYVVEAFMHLLQKDTISDGQQLLIRAASALGPDNELIFMKITQSITVFIASRSLAALMHLHDLYLNGELRTVMQQVFVELLDSKQAAIIDELIWDGLNYNRCVQHLAAASGLSVYAEIHKHSLYNKELPIGVLPVDTFPHELIEILLLKAASQLFSSITKSTTNAATSTLVTVGGVCLYWWKTLTGRSSTRRLRRYFTQLCRPFAFNPLGLTVAYLQSEGGYVHGLAVFDGKLYVAIRWSNTIEVYDSSYDPIEVIKVPGSLNPSDLAVCSSERCLFVPDFHTRCIWRVNLLSDSNVVDQTDQSPFIANLQYVPYTLSVQYELLLVTSHNGDALYVYNINDVERIQRISLPDYMKARHAVETSRETFVVAHVSRWNDDSQSDHTGVSELSADGYVLRVYQGPTPLSWPGYITTVDGHFLVRDNDSRQLLHLNSNLELVRLVLVDTLGNPYRQCYNHTTRTLFVAHENSCNVFFHRI